MFQPPGSTSVPQGLPVGAWHLGDDYYSTPYARRARGQAELSYLCGLDLGQRQDPSAAVILERQDFPREDRPSVFGVRAIKRWLGVPYPEVVAAVVALVGKLPGCKLVVDGTGCGAAVVDLLRKGGLTLTPVLITGGHSCSWVAGELHCSKVELVSVVQSLVGTGRLKIAAGEPSAQALLEEMRNFRVQISDTGHESFAAWRSKDHDDILLAAAVALVVSEREGPRYFGPSGPVLGSPPLGGVRPGDEWLML
jgi:hypothetical protein